MFEDIKQLKAKYDAAVLKAGKTTFTKYFNTIFEANPNIKQVQWAQYTPYFNDGDECIFGLHGVQVIDQNGEEYEFWSSGKGLEIVVKDIEKELDKLIDMLHVVFGNHAQVIVTRKGIEVEEYEHE